MQKRMKIVDASFPNSQPEPLPHSEDKISKQRQVRAQRLEKLSKSKLANAVKNVSALPILNTPLNKSRIENRGDFSFGTAAKPMIGDLSKVSEDQQE